MATCCAIAPSDLSEIEDFGDTIGVELQLDLEKEPAGPIIFIARVDRTHGAPGAGRRVIDRLCEVADEAEMRIQLCVLSWNESLIEYYASFGFEVIVFPEIDSREDHAVMERRPN